jgi:hypothetical protein
MDRTQIETLENQIAELKSRWPAHSVPPAMFQELEDLEEELEKAIEQSKRDQRAEENSSC